MSSGLLFVPRAGIRDSWSSTLFDLSRNKMNRNPFDAWDFLDSILKNSHSTLISLNTQHYCWYKPKNFIKKGSKPTSLGSTMNKKSADIKPKRQMQNYRSSMTDMTTWTGEIPRTWNYQEGAEKLRNQEALHQPLSTFRPILSPGLILARSAIVN